MTRTSRNRESTGRARGRPVARAIPRPSRSVPWRRILLPLAGVLLVVGLIAGLLLFLPILRVESVEVRQAPAAQHARVVEAAQVPMGEPLVKVDTDGVEERVMATGLYASVDAGRSWPSSVTIDARPREPVLALDTPGPGLRLVDEAGVAYTAVDEAPEGVPVATAARPDDPASTAALAEVAVGLRADHRALLRRFHIADDGRISLEVGRIDVAWGDRTDSRLKAAVVSRLLSAAGVGYIDVSAPMAPVTAPSPPSSTTGPATPTRPGSPSRDRSPSTSPTPTDESSPTEGGTPSATSSEAEGTGNPG